MKIHCLPTRLTQSSDEALIAWCLNIRVIELIVHNKCEPSINCLSVEMIGY